METRQFRQSTVCTLFFMSLVFVFGWPAAQCFAAIRTWDSGATHFPDLCCGDGFTWNDRFNWEPDQVPTGVDTAQVFTGSPIVNSANSIFSLENGTMITVRSSLVVGAGSAHNLGTILVTNGASVGNPSFGVAAGVLDGTGEVLLAESDFGTSVATLGGATIGAPSPTIHAAGHTIRGEGTINGRWQNESLILAEEVSGDTSAALQLGAGDITNSGVIRSSPTAAIVVNGLTYTGTAAGQFIADTQDVIIIDGTFNAGTLSALNGATYGLGFFGNIPQVTLNGATLAAPLNVIDSHGGSLFSSAGFINNSTITLDHHVAPSIAAITFLAPGIIGGTGEIILNREGGNTVIRGFTTITNGATHTIRGVGAISPQVFVNDGSIIAEPKNGTVLDITSQLTNNNLMQANSGAVMRLFNGPFTQDGAAGRIRAESGGIVELRASTIVGGRLQTAGTGVIQTGSGSGSITDVSNEGTLNVVGGTTLNVNGKLTNTGTITVNNNNLAAATNFRLASDVILQGTGSLVLNMPGFQAAVTTTSGSVITQNAGHTIRGLGQINTVIVNHGRLEGVSAAQPLELNNAVLGDGVLKDVRIDGTFIPGGIGTSAIVPLEGSYTQNASAQLRIDLGGTIPGSGYDQLNSTGSITLNPNSRLDVFVVPGFVPAAGNQFTVATTTGSRSGTFGTVSLPANIPNYELTWKPVAYTPSSIILEVLSVTALPGDYNANGVVDAADYVVWRNTLGQTGSGLAADGNFNNQIDSGDFNVWKAYFGQTAGSGAALTAVPEPSSLFLGIAALIPFGMGRRKSDSF